MTLGEFFLVFGILLAIFTYQATCFMEARVWGFPNLKKVCQYLIANGDKLVLNEFEDKTPTFSPPGHGSMNWTIRQYKSPILYKWYIKGLGPIIRWSHAHRYLEKLYKAKMKKGKKYLREKKYIDAFGEIK